MSARCFLRSLRPLSLRRREMLFAFAALQRTSRTQRVTDRNSQRVSRISRLWQRVQSQYPRHHTFHLDFYPHEELEKLIERSSAVLGIQLEDGAARQLAMRSRGTPRIANRLLRRVRDWAIVHDLESVRPDDVKEALALYQIDTEGLDRLDIAVLKAIVTNFNGGPVGLNNLAAMVGEESETVETVCEPYLVREGFLIRTPKGRVATRKAWEHLGITPDESAYDVNKMS